MRRTPWVLLALLVGAGCVPYRGGAHDVDPARITADSGWILAAPTPALRQRGELDCGAASLAMVANRWHVALTVASAARALPAPDQHGVQLGDLRDAARAQGLTAYAIAGDRATLLHELGARRPVIVGLLLPYGGKRVQPHYEVIVAARPADDQFVTLDPGRGWRVRSWAALDAEWHPAGRPTLVVLGPAVAVK